MIIELTKICWKCKVVIGCYCYGGSHECKSCDLAGCKLYEGKTTGICSKCFDEEIAKINKELASRKE